MDASSLRRGNALLAVLHAAQAAVILALSTDFALPVTGTFMAGRPGSGTPKQDVLFNLPIGPLVGACLVLAAIDHGGVALPPLRARYERYLAEGVNPFRWLEYSFSEAARSARDFIPRGRLHLRTRPIASGRARAQRPATAPPEIFHLVFSAMPGTVPARVR